MNFITPKALRQKRDENHAKSVMNLKINCIFAS